LKTIGDAGGISSAATLLAAGDIVGLPTETVYGLGADALNPLACARIFEAKGRPLNDPLIVHVPDIAWAHRLAEFSPLAESLAAAFWPGPLTLVLPRRDIVPDVVTSGQSTVAIRWSAHPVFQKVIDAFGRPIAAPSANRFGRISPTSADDVIAELGEAVPLVVDGGRCEHGIESAIILVTGDTLHILRHGPITREELEEFGTVAEPADPEIHSPGTFKSHYAPLTPLEIVRGKPTPRADCGLLAWSHDGTGFEIVEHLSRTGDLREAAANLFGAMRRLDAAGLKSIIAEALPNNGLGAAIMERLEKAAAR
jgi:L-threonylcarbamoyladenylate synthase